MPVKPLKIGVTGGIGAGKSIVCSVFQVLGIPCFNADDVSKELLGTSTKVIEAVKQLLGDKAYTDEGVPDRKYIAGQVFNDETKLKSINRILHPEVEAAFQLWANDLHAFPYVIKEAALLFESGSYKKLDKILLVTAPREVRIDRVIKRDPHRQTAQIESIIEQQLPDQEKIKRADFIVNNDEKSLIIPQILKIHENLIN